MKNSKNKNAEQKSVKQPNGVETGYRVIVLVAVPGEDVLYRRECGIFETREKAVALGDAFLQSEMGNCEVVCMCCERIGYIKTKEGIFAQSITKKD